MARWMVSAKKADFDAIAARFHISPVTARLLRNRDVTDVTAMEVWLNGTMKDCHAPHLLPDVEQAARCLLDAVSQKKRIRIVGDYDADGICSTVILLRGLSFLGAEADYCIPHRLTDGYGINNAIVEQAHEDGVALLLTCDNGISAFEQADRAKELGIGLVITDHHDVPCDAGSGEQIVPDALAVVDPKREATDGVSYPFSGICGAVVACKLLQVLFALAGKEEAAHPLMGDITELAALATVCDVMPLTDENRLIVREGLGRMEHSAFAGIRALCEVNGLAGKRLGSYHLGFVLGPCLNASGRLDSAAKGVELLMTDDEKQAVRIANGLKEFNASRKLLTEQLSDEAVRAVEEEGLIHDRVLVLYLEGAHEAVIGIVAGRLKERYHRPAIVLTDAEEGIKGSGRSIEQYNLFRELSKCAHLFTRFGGHPMAAGMSLASKDDAAKLRRALNDACTLTEEDLTGTLHLDMELPPYAATTELLEEWEKLEPFGNGNPKPLFGARDIALLRGRIIGKSGTVGKYTVADARGQTYDMMLFRGLDAFHAFLDTSFGAETQSLLYGQGFGRAEAPRIKIAYYPDVNEYGGRKTIQLVVEDYMR